MRIGLGTVQFGMDYGVTNVAGQTPEPEVRRILELAAHAGITVLDTAQAYGESEGVLGRQLSVGHPFRIVTKIPPILGDRPEAIASVLESEFQRSLERLASASVYGLLVHDSSMLLAPNGRDLWAAMRRLQEGGLVQKIGASVYHSDQVAALRKNIDLDIIQLPINLLDQRIQVAGELDLLQQSGVEIHARSVFLQGLLLAQPDDIDECFAGVRDHLKWLRTYLSDHGLSALSGALSYPLQCRQIDTVLVGVNRVSELRQILDALPSARAAQIDHALCAIDDDRILNPSRWPPLPTAEAKRDRHC